MKRLHKKGKYKPDDLSSEPAYRELLTQTHNIINAKVTDSQLSRRMKGAFTYNTFLFAGLKTHAHLFEAANLLNAKGEIKSFEQWYEKAEKVCNRHKHYLEAEYDFAVSSVQMAERWEGFKPGDRYYLQYRTASDDRVRISHRPLHNITLPKSDPFWDKYFPPNGWRCRCTTVQVLKDDYDPSDSVEAQKAGEKATTYLNKNGKNKLEIFRFNAGKDGIVFPKNHPYFKVKGADKAKPVILSVFHHSFARYKGIGFKPIKGIKNGGVLEKFTKGRQYKSEWFDNKRATLILANQGEKYRLLPVINDNEKNPDAFNLKLKVFSDIKTLKGNNVKNAFQNGMKAASKQGAGEFIFQIRKKISRKDYLDILFATRNILTKGYNRKVKYITIIFPDKNFKRYEVSKLKRRWLK